MYKIQKKIIITSVVIAFFVGASANAQHYQQNIDKNSLVTFKHIMQGLLSETKMITQGIILEDFTLINDATENIINHPKPAMSQRKKLMKALGDDIATFKGLDHIVHRGAMKIQQAAKDKNMVVVIAEYQKLITGCQSCHSTFKARLSKALL
ncbi:MULTISPECIES: hypothetical protein [unclassified Colwellia]|uniref:hypothetical protein n=1 Tax=unclassified Colwellia TaxID=196834 RepID=UPI0015F47406|nr:MULTISPECIES: hypothetical protein [unclassified Colwellia]MBA6230744.1 hypothetical protein [Colwellia sp. MB02u-7]MBA6234675.1 hypothetical protein [Colwellia sp. MB02u-11]MBA6255538.1 hypothetical protein [Colwellia sp. MB3u-28]MBA6261678.1 hypothetical protein [Colwellia sp. MB3u-41]MBA6301229.1 hypothetical protein [Colwellia sp. MB3u-22]